MMIMKGNKMSKTEYDTKTIIKTNSELAEVNDWLANKL